MRANRTSVPDLPNPSPGPHSPTPLPRPLRLVGRTDRVDGRKIHTSATLHHGDTLCAEAEGLFVSMKPEVFVRLMQDRAQRTDRAG